MSYTIYKSTSGLIAQPGRAVSTFPSGLVRVEQTYLGLTANAAANRAALAVGNNMPDGDSSPCIDGLKIFPEVQERRREDGFTEYQVCAYGRCNSTGTRSESALITTVGVYHSNWHVTSSGGTASSTGQKLLIYEAILPIVTQRSVVSSLATFAPPAVTVMPYSIKVKRYNSTEEVFIPYTVWEAAVIANGTQPSFTHDGQSLTIWNNASILVGGYGNDLRFLDARTKDGDTSIASIERTEFTPYGSFNESVVTYNTGALGFGFLVFFS
jgi:hypothetical protein